MQQQDRILVLNSGSSSLKFAIINPLDRTTHLEGLAERLGNQDARLSYRVLGNRDKQSLILEGHDHEHAIEAIIGLIRSLPGGLDQIAGVGHRVVHGGESFTASSLISEAVVQEIRDCSALAPLHNPANLTGIESMSRIQPDLPQVAVFDTSFHQSLPPRAFLYALPYELYRDQRLRRYGFHGTSHRYIAGECARILDRAADSVSLISVHLGNGCSAAAIRQGKSVDTTMGMTPLEGLVMGTRCGDVDPGLIIHLQNHLGYSADQVDHLLNRESGLLGLSGESNDMRTLLSLADDGHEQARLAIDVFCYRLAKNIAALMVAAQPLDAIVFTGGIGENAAPVREQVLNQLGFFGIRVEKQRNLEHGRQSDGVISADDSLRVMVIPTNEELMIAQDTFNLIKG